MCGSQEEGGALGAGSEGGQQLGRSEALSSTDDPHTWGQSWGLPGDQTGAVNRTGAGWAGEGAEPATQEDKLQPAAGQLTAQGTTQGARAMEGMFGCHKDHATRFLRPRGPRPLTPKTHEQSRKAGAIIYYLHFVGGETEAESS